MKCNLQCIHCYPDSGIEHKKMFADDEFKKCLTTLKCSYPKALKNPVIYVILYLRGILCKRLTDA